MLPAGRTGLISFLILASLLAGPATAQILTSGPPPLPAWDFAGVRLIATEIQAAAERARLTASQQTRPGRREQSVVLTDLTALASAAQHFSTQLDQFPHSPEPTRPAYLELVRIHNSAYPRLVNAGYDAGVVSDFSGIEALLNRLSLVYTQQWDIGRARMAAEALDSALRGALNTARQRAQDQPPDRRALFFLNRSAQAAQFLRQQLDREQDPLVTGEDFQCLADDYALALRSLQPAGFGQYLEGDLTRGGQALAQLRQAYRAQWNGPNARNIADQIRVSAQHVLERVAERAHRDGGTEPRLLDHLRLLAEVSDQLTRHLELGSEVPLRTYPDFLTLVAAYGQASFDLAQAWFGSQMMAEINSMGRQMTQLDRMYSGAMDQGPAHLTGTVIGR